ncbi:MAG: hypothetical protein IKW85_12095 [Muribaculaceae bacterium]|nr:hypothetical protein [Muribaculaceae bacterium]
MRKISFLLLTMIVVLALGSCKKEKPMYVYIDCENLDSQPKPFSVEADDDVSAFYKSFEKYASDRHFVEFKSRMPIDFNGGGSEACESDEADQGAIQYSEVDGSGEIMPSGDSDEMEEYIYPNNMDVDNTPNFVLYKIADKKSRQVAQDFIDKKISFEEFQEKVKDNVEIIYDNVQHKDIYEKEFQKCKEIDYNAYCKMREDFNKKVKEAQRKEQ